MTSLNELFETYTIIKLVWEGIQNDLFTQNFNIFGTYIRGPCIMSQKTGIIVSSKQRLIFMAPIQNISAQLADKDWPKISWLFRVIT